MSIIKPRANRVRTVRHIARLQEPNRDVLVQYARFIGDTVLVTAHATSTYQLASVVVTMAERNATLVATLPGVWRG